MYGSSFGMRIYNDGKEGAHHHTLPEAEDQTTNLVNLVQHIMRNADHARARFGPEISTLVDSVTLQMLNYITRHSTIEFDTQLTVQEEVGQYKVMARVWLTIQEVPGDAD